MIVNFQTNRKGPNISKALHYSTKQVILNLYLLILRQCYLHRYLQNVTEKLVHM